MCAMLFASDPQSGHPDCRTRNCWRKNHYLMGGTGKYKGITGTIPYTVVELHDTVGGHPANIVNHKAKWEIK
jgi:hypothetical protein